MIPQTVTLQNFLSFGPRQEITFADDEPLWCISGPNGVGKSAIFDAITYCLYGEHRGKGAGHPLIRHGENGFQVSFEFRLHDAVYRITRNRPRRGQPTQSVEVRTNAGDWRVLEHLNAVADVDAWVVETLGIGFESFKASVMLRQGEAANIVDANGGKRHEILSKVIGLERFESLADAVDAEAKLKRVTHKALKDRIGRMTAVAQEELDAAEASQTAAAGDCEKTEEAKAAAARRVADAGRWTEFEAEISKLEKELADAAERSRQAEAIQKKNERLIELERVLPTLERWLEVRAGETANEKSKFELDPERTAASAARARAEQCCRDADALKKVEERIALLEKVHTLAEESERLEVLLAKFPTDLAEQLRAATARQAAASAEERRSGDVRMQAKTRWQHAAEAEAKLADLEIGVRCSRCGTIVSAEHAANERRDAAEELERNKAALRDAEAGHRFAQEELSRANSSGEELQRNWKERDRLHGLQSTVRAKLEAYGSANEPATIRRERDEARLQREDLRTSLKATADPVSALQEAIRRCETLERRAAELDTAAAALRGTKETLAASLDPIYHGSTPDECRQLGKEAAALRDEDVAGQFRELMADVQRQRDRTERMQEWNAKAEAIPVEARIPIAEARRIESDAAAAARIARQRFDDARAELARLLAGAESYRTLKGEILAAETAERLHDRLAKLLGPGGLQRELMRDAEKEIVRHADGIVRNLSNGDLSIELNPSEKKEKEALVLQVRRAESPDPIPVEYLSGSQKFRVAISIALAIGRFATGQTRPLECVIIDEGFGSLDKDGLEATAQELKRLKQYLKRIILVSHQEEFTDHFPSMIRLKPGENGTTVESLRGG